MLRVMQGRRLSRTYILHFFVLTSRDYLTQVASHTIRFTLLIVSCLLLYDCGPVRGRGFCQVQMCPAQEIEEHKQFVQKETGHYYALLAKQIFLT